MGQFKILKIICSLTAKGISFINLNEDTEDPKIETTIAGEWYYNWK